ncbi:hypothetical protein K470DRAFT_151478 [Piedraia hortae CBS 480.64]|uniref:Uncharacterized protein n=1 Tax=Piedraia hortae CBS 480.64 TaxID=1314780 RepID=A0A6A7BRK9_9PEZI|nr:hypothetical protein K470DRAFT_151478 [Piedraia hortae CBS 480.64]
MDTTMSTPSTTQPSSTRQGRKRGMLFAKDARSDRLCTCQVCANRQSENKRDSRGYVSDSSVPHIYMERFEHKVPRKVPYEMKSVMKKYVVYARAKHYDAVLPDKALRTNVVDHYGCLFRSYTRGPFRNMCAHEHKRVCIGPELSLATLDMADSPAATGENYIHFTYFEQDDPESFMISHAGQSHVMTFVENCSTGTIREVAQSLYVHHIRLGTLYDYVPRLVLDGMTVDMHKVGQTTRFGLCGAGSPSQCLSVVGEAS